MDAKTDGHLLTFPTLINFPLSAFHERAARLVAWSTFPASQDQYPQSATHCELGPNRSFHSAGALIKLFDKDQ
jgi:hypothetical protein